MTSHFPFPPSLYEARCHSSRRAGNEPVGVVNVYYGNYTDYVRAKKGLPPLAEGEVSEI